MGANSVNLIALRPGDVVRLSDGSKVKILQNPGDGVWVFGFYLTEGMGHDDEAPEEPIFAQEIDELLSSDT